MNLENSSFENNNNQIITPENASSIVSLLYQSSQHTVYKVKINNRWMFLKRINEKHRNNPLYIDNLQREFEIGFSLDHPGIVNYFNLGKDHEGTYLLTEYVDGQMLREYLTKQKPTLEFIKKIINQLIDILSYLHKKNIYHLDLKPENLLISTKNEQLKLIDFGLAHADSYSKTPSGTPKYAAPEMFSSPELCNASSDIYSIGIILLELFTGSTDKQNIKNIPIIYRKTIKKCIKEKQLERFQNCQELHKALLIERRKHRFIIFLTLCFLISIILIVNKKNQKSYPLFNKQAQQKIDNQKNKINTIKAPNSSFKVQKTNYSKNNINKINSSLDSLNQYISHWHKDKMTQKDSLFIIDLRVSLFEKYKQKIDDTLTYKGFRSKKTIIIELIHTCLEEFNNAFETHTSTLSKEKLSYFESLNFFKNEQNKLRKQLEVIPK